MLDRPAILLKFEEACLLTATVLAYRHFHFSWLLFAVLFLAPDLFMLGYRANPRIGASIYNLGHFLFLPIAIFIGAWVLLNPPWMAVALIWVAHIAWDRMLGYGLKYPTFFKDTHLQHIP